VSEINVAQPPLSDGCETVSGMGHLLGYARVSTTNLLSFFVGFGALLFTAQYLQLVLGLSPLEAGLWSLPSSAGFILGSMATPLLVTGSVIFSLALAPVDTLATDLAVEAAPPERAGAASAITETSAEFGGALGIAVLGVVGTAVHRARWPRRSRPWFPTRRQRRPVTPWAGAVAVAGQLPERVGAACWRWPGGVHPGPAPGRCGQRRGRAGLRRPGRHPAPRRTPKLPTR
jgi:hypothetical protein